MIEILVKKIESLGFTVIPDKRDGANGFKKHIHMDSIPTVEQMIRLFHLLSTKEELSFWNKYEPKRTDPGAYISVIVTGEDSLMYKKGNHGWMTQWKQMSYHEMAELIILNWAEDLDWGEYENQITLEENRFVSF